MATVARESSTGSVAIPVYTPRYRATVIASVLAQTFNDHEIVMLDDGWGDPPETEGYHLGQANQRHGTRPEGERVSNSQD